MLLPLKFPARNLPSTIGIVNMKCPHYLISYHFSLHEGHMIPQYAFIIATS